MKDTKEDNIEIAEEFTIQVQNVLNAMKHPGTSQSMQESKEVIYSKVEQKINTDTFALPSRRKQLIRYISIASVIALLIASISTLTYFSGYYSATKELVQTNVEVQVPFGMISHMTLPDGTGVTLNGGSKLVYPASFAGERHVSLSGEGFFEVAKDLENPFFVHSENLLVKVLGTRFGFKAYKEDKQTILTLQSGSVSAFPSGNKSENGILLEPNQQIVLDNETKEFQRKNVIADEYITWKDGILTFRELTIEDISIILERRFGIKINIVSEKIKEEQYTAQFKHGEGLEEILDKLSYKRSWKYKKRNCKIEIESSK